MIKDEYSPYKIMHRFDLIEKLKNKEDFYPQQVHFVPTNTCNHNCSFCAYRMEGYSSNETFEKQDTIPFDRCIEILNDLKAGGTKAIQFTGGGEPTVHPKIKEILKHTLDLGFELALVTNGMNLNDETIDILSKASWVRISLDSACKETYSKIKKVSLDKFDKTISNIRKFALTKSEGTTFGIGFVVTRENYKEIYAAAKICKDLGVDNFRISASFTTHGIKYFDGILDEAKRLAKAAFDDFNDDNFTVFNLFNDRISDLFDGTQDYDFCPMKNLVVYVGADLNVYTCCVQAYNKNGFIGSLKDKSFSEFWESDKRKLFYKTHNPRIRCKLPCMFENKNHFINYALKPDAKHVNFL